MGVGAYACYKLTIAFSRRQYHPLLILCSGFFAAAVGTVFWVSPRWRIKGFYLAVATLAAQFFLSWCFIRVAWLYNYNISASIEVPTRAVLGIPITGPTATPVTRYLVGALDRRADDAPCLQPRPRPHRPHVDGGARHGYRSRTDRHPALPDQAARLRGVLVLLRRGRRNDGVSLARRGRVRELQHQPVVPRAVHGHHRRPGQPDGLVPGSRADLGPADCAAERAGSCRAVHARGDGRAYHLYGGRRAHHFLPDRRAARLRGCGRSENRN